ncbi:MAG: hypothetical protein LBF02_02190 [Mycoplasmataceae bacterium]|nr:hypothetical protein [Mycoplasmataceae bacterium]
MLSNYVGHWKKDPVYQYEQYEDLEDKLSTSLKKFIAFSVIFFVIALATTIVLSINIGDKNIIGAPWKVPHRRADGIIDGKVVSLWYIVSWVIASLLFIFSFIGIYFIFYTWKQVKNVRTWLVNAQERFQIEERKMEVIENAHSFVPIEEVKRIEQERNLSELKKSEKIFE